MNGSLFQTQPLDPDAARTERDRILSRFEENSAPLLMLARAVMIDAALDRPDGTASADDVAERMPWPEGKNRASLGAVPGSLARLGLVRRFGIVKSGRANQHATAVTRWKVTSRRHAREWLHNVRGLMAAREPMLFDLIEWRIDQ